METIEKLQTGKATRPASKWRNKYLSLRLHQESADGELCYAGKECWSKVAWPSRDIAETMGKKWESENPTFAKYIGAFPVDAT